MEQVIKMSYCVNCGVELKPSEQMCPLCGTEVVNPRQPYDRKAPKPFPERMDLFMPQDNRGFIASIVTLVLMLPSAICLSCDAAYTGGSGWSMLVVGAMAMLWVLIVPALFFRCHPIVFGVVLDTGALLGYLWIIERYTETGSWFLRLALPIVLLLAVLFTLDYLLAFRLVRGRFRQAAVVMASLSVLPVGIEMIIDSYLSGAILLQWAVFVAIPCLILALLMLVLGRRERFKEQMKKRLHM